jgi:hypothetical protein
MTVYESDLSFFFKKRKLLEEPNSRLIGYVSPIFLVETLKYFWKSTRSSITDFDPQRN